MKALLRASADWLASPGVVAKVFPRPPAARFEWASCRRIIVIKLDEIGDFVLSTPFLRELRRNCPAAEITLVVKPGVFPLAQLCLHVNRVIQYDGQTKGLSAWQARRQWRAYYLANMQLRGIGADVAVIPRWGEDAYNATNLAAYSRPRAIVAYSEKTTPAKERMNPGLDGLVSHVVPPHSPRHEVGHNLALIEAFGGRVESSSLEIGIPSESRAGAPRLIAPGGRLVALGCGALDPRRRWPVERFNDVAQCLSARFGLSAVTLGSAGDPSVAGAIDLAGRTSLVEAAAVLEQCALFVGNDSGLMHLAAAVGVPVVEVSGFRDGGDANDGNSPARFHPWGVPYRVVQPPGGADTLAIGEVAAAAVEQACIELLAGQ